METTATPKFRKAKNGKWVAFGPVSQVRVGSVTVLKANGERKSVTVESLGQPFSVDGVQCVYGYLSDDTPRSTARRTSGGWDRADRYDHEDCLSFSSCCHGPNARCDYH